MPSHQLEPEATHAEIVRLDNLQQVDEVLFRVPGGPVQQLVLLTVSELADLGDLISAVVVDRDRRRGVDDAP